MRLSTRPCDCQAQWILFIGYKGAGRDRAAKDGDDSQSSQRDQPRDCARAFTIFWSNTRAKAATIEIVELRPCELVVVLSGLDVFSNFVPQLVVLRL